MTQVTIPTAIGGDGLPFSDDGTSARDMQGQGYASHFLPMINQVVAASAIAVQAAGAIATGSTNTTSATSLAIGTGSKSLTVETDKALVPGMWVLLAYRADPAKNMTGQVTSYNAGTGALVINVTAINGAGTFADWAGSVTGAPGLSIPRVLKTGAYTLTAADKGALIDCSGTWTLGLAAAATLGAGWWCYVRNIDTGDIALDPNASETIDGLTSFVLYPGAVRLIVCNGSALLSVPLVGGTKTFTATGTYVWAPGIQSWIGDVIGGGAGGGGGARSATEYHGGGGGAGERIQQRILNSQITVGASVTCTVGAGAPGGAAASADNANGSNGSNTSGDSSIGTILTANRGILGFAGTTSAYGAGGQGGATTPSSQTTPFAGQLGATGTTSVGAQVIPTEWAGPNGRPGDDSSPAVTSTLGKTTGGSSGAHTASQGQNGINPGDGGNGGAGAINGSAASKGGDGAAGRIVIVEVI